MNRRNEGISESDILQNQFTAYLQISLQRCKSQYLSKLDNQRIHETEMPREQEAIEEDFCNTVAEKVALSSAMKQIKEREKLRRRSRRKITRIDGGAHKRNAACVRIVDKIHDALCADAPLRFVDDPHEGQVVRLVLNQAHVAHHVLDLFTVVISQAAQHAVRDAPP